MASKEEIKKNIEDNAGSINKKDYVFYNIDFLNTLADATEKERIKCQECVGNLELLLTLSRNYPAQIQSGSKGKKELEEAVEGITNHLIKVHGYRRKGWQKALYTFFGLIIGLTIAALVSKFAIVNLETAKIAFCLITVIFWITGSVIGGIKERRQAKSGKIL